MKLEVVEGPEALARRAADEIEAEVRARPDLTVLVATGNTPMATYAELARRVQMGGLDASRATAVQLDEYLGLTPGDPRSLWDWMRHSFVDPLGLRRTLRLESPEAFEREVAALGGIDLAILGLGPNGHLGFNEPPSAPDAPTREVTLSAESRRSNAAYWPGLPVPDRALTAGMGVILAARRSLLLVSGAHKRDILRRTLHDEPSPDLPASLLRGGHLTVLADRAAAGP